MFTLHAPLPNHVSISLSLNNLPHLLYSLFHLLLPLYLSYSFHHQLFFRSYSSLQNILDMPIHIPLYNVMGIVSGLFW